MKREHTDFSIFKTKPKNVWLGPSDYHKYPEIFTDTIALRYNFAQTFFPSALDLPRVVECYDVQVQGIEQRVVTCAMHSQNLREPQTS